MCHIGIVNRCFLLIWVDAKYTYTEKSFVKVALMGNAFPGHRTKVEKWVDSFGHESSFLDPEVADLILVISLSLSLSLPPSHSSDLLNKLLRVGCFGGCSRATLLLWSVLFLYR